MNDYEPIVDVVERLSSDYDWAHSFIRECYAITSHVMVEYVDESGIPRVGDVDGPRDIRLVVAAAGNELNTGIEFIFRKVTVFSIQSLDELAFEYTYDNRSGHTVCFTRKQNLGDCYITAESVFVRFLRRSYMGIDQLIGYVLPSSEAVVATNIGSCWRQCANCNNAWEENPKVKFSRCPNCGEVTKLKT